MSRQRGAQMLSVGDKREVFVTAFEVDKQENAFRFWGQFDNEAVERMEIVMEEAQVQAEQSSHPPPGSLSQGDVCLAKFMEDGQWYRARVESVTGNDVIAYFIDFGNTEIIPRVMVRNVDQSVLDLPPQATNCKLANVEPVLDNSSLKAGTHDYIRKQLEYQTFCAEVIARIGGNLEVKLSEVNTNKDVAQSIIQNGFGRKATGGASPSQRKGYKMTGLDVGCRERVFVSNVNTPNQFWVQQEALTTDLDELMNDMLAHFSQTDSSARKARFSRGDPCVTTFSDDGSFYRALVTNTMGSNKYEVLFVDYGNSDVKSADDLLDIKKDFLRLPVVAIESCLSDVTPDSCTSDQASSRFEELVAEKTICCKVTRKIGDKCSLLMIDPTGGENADIASVLVKEGLAARHQIDSPVAKTSPAQGFSARNVSPSQSPARELDFNSPKFKMSAVRVGDELAVQVTYVKNGAEFACHLVRDADKFEVLTEGLQKTYSSCSPGDHGVPQVAAGLPCCVQFSEDNSWYRAEVTHVRGHDIEVRYVDYGNSETVTAAQVKSLKPQFFNLPIQSITCSLDNVPQASAAKSQEVKDFIDSTVAELDLMAKIVSVKSGMNIVQLTDPASGDNINAMVKGMLAESSPRVRSPREQMQLEYNAQCLRQGEKLQVFLGHVDEQAKIFVQQTSTVGELEALMEHMGQHFAQYGTSIPNLSIGMPCAAQYSADDGWYRAKVTGIRRNGAVEVTFVDYGNSEMVDSSKIKLLTPDMMKLPSQAIPCVLQGLPPGQQTSDDVAKLQEYIESECTIEVKSKDNTSGAYTVQMTGPDGRCINDQFKKAPPVTKQMPNDRTIRSPPRNDGFGSGSRYQDRSQSKRDEFGSNSGFKAKSPPQNDRYSQNSRPVRDRDPRESRGKSGRYSDGGGDAPEHGRSSRQRSDRGSVSSSISDRSNRSGGRPDDSRKGFGGKSNSTSHEAPPQPVVPLHFKEVAFPSRGTTQVFISNVNSPDEFWCQTADSTPQLQRVMSELHARYSSLRPSDKQLTNTTVGTPCVAQFSQDQCWYRGVVINKHVRMLDVMFVDYGNSEKVALKNVKEIIPDLLKLPVLAVKCSLQGDDKWHDAQTEAMKVASDRAEPFQCEVKRTDCGVYVVELTWEGKKMTPELRKIKPSPPPVVQSVTPKTSMPSQATPPALAKISMPTPSATSVHIPSELESLQVDGMEDVVISYWEGPARFWCQLAAKGGDLDALMGSLEQAESSAKVSVASEGLVCLAKYAEDGAWYRARVTKAVPTDRPEVYFIDYGNHSTVTLSDLRVISKTSTSLPAQAIQCTLDGLTLAQAMSSAAVERFTELISEKQLVAKVVRKESSKATVTLHDTNTADDIDICEEIKKVIGDVKEPEKYPPPVISGGPEQVFVTNVDSASGTVFIQLSSSTEQLDTVTSTLQSTYGSCSTTDHQLIQPVVSQACCTKFSEDEQWYRGVITMATPTSATVLFVDYGNSEEKPVSELKLPTAELLEVPPIALECRLDGLPLSPWKQDAADHLLNITAEKELTCTFKTKQQTFSISLKDEALDINSELTKFFDTATSEAAKELCVYPQPTISTDPQSGYVVNVDGTAGKVYIQLASATDQLDAVTNVLANTYGSCGNKLQLSQPCSGQACCTKFSEDGQWYRGTITTTTASSANVFFIDYGNSEEKQISELKAPTQELLQIPQIALECNLEAASTSLPWQQETVDHLLNLTSDKELMCSFSSANKPYLVSMTDGAVNINAEMVKVLGVKGIDSTAQDATKQAISYPPAEVGEGTHQGYVVNVDATTGNIYVQMASATEQLDAITAALESKYATAGPELQLKDPSLNQPCCTKFSEDDQWYRGIVKSTTSSTANVFFIDYGNQEEKEFGDLKSPTQELLQIPQVAVECCLAGVAEKPWDQEAVDHFLNITAEKELSCSFKTSKPPYSITVKDDTVDINAEMMNLIGEQPLKDESKEAPSSFKTQVPVLAVQKRAEVYITATTSPTDFWIQPLAGEEALAELMDELNAYAENPNTSGLASPAVGSPCVAKYSSDDGWYRAVVTGVTEDSATVLFVDYGNSDTVGVENLKVISPSLMELVTQAVPGSLAGIGPIQGEELTAEAVEFFETAVADKLLLMEVVTESNGKLEVKLMDMGMSITEKLVNEGHAVSTTASVRQFPSVTSEPEASLDQTSKGLVEQVLVDSLHDLSLEVSVIEETDLTEADMDVGPQETVEATKTEDCLLTPASATEDIAHSILDMLLAEIALNLESGHQRAGQELDLQGAQRADDAAEVSEERGMEGERVEEEEAEGAQPEEDSGVDDRQNEQEQDKQEEHLAEGDDVRMDEEAKEEEDRMEDEEVEGTQPEEDLAVDRQNEREENETAEEESSVFATSRTEDDENEAESNMDGQKDQEEEAAEDDKNERERNLDGQKNQEEEGEEEEEEAAEDDKNERERNLDGQKNQEEGEQEEEAAEDDKNEAESNLDGQKEEEEEEEEEEAAEDELNEAAESDSAVPVTTDESFAAEETFQSEEDFFKDEVATEADQHKSVEPREEDEEERGMEEEEEEEKNEEEEEEIEEEDGFEDAVQTLADDVAKTLSKVDEQNAEPEADQAKIEQLKVDDNTVGAAVNDTEIKDGGGVGGVDVAGLPEDDITMATTEKEDVDEVVGLPEDGSTLATAENSDVVDVAGLPEDDVTMVTAGEKDVDDIPKAAEESLGDLGQVFSKMELSDEQAGSGNAEQAGENGVNNDAESDVVAISNITVESAEDGVQDDHTGDVKSPEGDAANGDQEFMDGGGDAPAVAKETCAEVTKEMVDVETDVNESFETARGDISYTSPGGDGSLYASLSTISVGSGDLDSTLECDKTLDLTESPESGTCDAQDFGKVVGGGGDAPLSPPRCDSGIMEEVDGTDDIVQDAKEAMKANLMQGSKDGPVEALSEESIVNGN